MKNLLAVLGLFFAFTLTSFAQDAHMILAKKEAESLLKVVDLNSNNQDIFLDLMIKKHEMLAKNPRDKKNIAAAIASKLEGLFTAEELAQVKNNKSLYKDLLH